MAESIVTDVIAKISADSSNFVRGMQLAAQSAQRMQSQVQSVTNGSDEMTRAMQGAEMRSQFMARGLNLVGAAAAIAGATLINFGRKSFQAAAAVNELDVAMEAVGKSTGLGYKAMRDATLAVRDNGIEMKAAQEMVLLYAKANLNLGDAQKVARVAQDLAVLSGSNSTETATRLTYAIMNQDTQMLRSVGVTKSAGEAFADYAKANGLTAKSLTEVQKKAAITNMILAEGAKVAGVYEAAMKEPAKVLRSFPRLFNDIQLAVGQGLTEAFGPLIVNAYHATKQFSLLVREGGALAPYVDAIGRAFTYLMKPLTDVVGKIGDFFEHKQEIWEMGKKFRESAEGVKKLGEHTKVLAGQFTAVMPLVTAITAMLAIKAGQSFLGDVPIIGSFVDSLNPLLGGLVGLLLTTPQAQEAIMKLVGAFKPLIPIVGQITVVLGQVLNKVVGFLSAQIGKLADVVQNATEWLGKHKEVIYIVVGAITVYMLLTKGVSAVTMAWAKATQFLTLAMAGLNLPLLAVIAVVSLLVYAFVQAYKGSQEFRDKVAEVFNSVVNTVGGAISNTLRWLGDLLVGFSKSMSVGGNLRETFIDTFNTIAKVVGGALSFVIGGFGRLLLAYANLITSNKTVHDTIVLVFNGIAKVIGGVIAFIFEQWSATLGLFADVLDQLNGFGKGWEEIWEKVVDIVKNAFTALFKGLGKIGTAIYNWFKGVRDNANRVAKDLEPIKQATGQMGDEMETQTNSWTSKTATTLRQWSANLLKASKAVKDFSNKDFGTAIVDGMAKGATVAGNALVSISEKIKEFSSKDWGTGVADALASISLSVGASLVNMANKIDEFSKGDAFGRMKVNIKSFMDLTTGMLDGVKKSAKDTTGTLKPLTNALDEAAKASGKAIVSAKQRQSIMLDGAKSAMADMKERAKSVLDFAYNIQKNVSDFGGIMTLAPEANVPVTAEMVLANMTQRLNQISEFGNNLKALSKMNLNNSSLQEIISAGPVAGNQIAKALIQAGQSAVSDVNTTQDAIGAAAFAVSGIGADSQSKYDKTGISFADAQGIADKSTKVYIGEKGIQINVSGAVDAKTEAVLKASVTRAMTQALNEYARTHKNTK